jgi:hypothetical protein
VHVVTEGDRDAARLALKHTKAFVHDCNQG